MYYYICKKGNCKVVNNGTVRNFIFEDKDRFQKAISLRYEYSLKRKFISIEDAYKFAK